MQAMDSKTRRVDVGRLPGRIRTSCAICGKTRSIKRSEYLKNKYKKFFCSREHMAIGFGRRILPIGRPISSMTPRAGHLRAWRMFPDGVCEVCGAKGERHHRDGNPTNNIPSNIQMLCRKHHMKADGRISMGKKFGHIGGRSRANNGPRDAKGRFV